MNNFCSFSFCHFLTEPVIVDEHVHKDVTEMQGKLGGLIFRVKKIVEKAVQLEELQEFLTLSYPYMEDEIAKTTSFKDVFHVVRRYCSLTNYTMLCAIACEFELDNVHDLIEKYKKDEDFYKRKILDEQFALDLQEEAKLLEHIPQISETIQIKLDWANVDDTTISEFCSLLRDTFTNMARYIHLHDIRPGCIYCTCFAPAVLMEALRKLAREKVTFLQEMGVVLLTIGGIVILDETKKNEGEEKTEKEEEVDDVTSSGVSSYN